MFAMAHSVETRHLRMIQALHDTGRLDAAAERLHISPSALTHAVHRLERQIGGRLFQRRSRPLRFTVAGQRLLALADTVLPLLQQAEADVARLQTRRTIYVGTDGVLHALAATAAERFRSDWPEVDLVVGTMDRGDGMAALGRGELDLLLTQARLARSGLRFRPLARMERTVALPPGGAMSRQPFVEPAELAYQTVFTLAGDRQARQHLTVRLESAGARLPRWRTAMTAETALEWVADGRALALLPAALCRGARVETRP